GELASRQIEQACRRARQPLEELGQGELFVVHQLERDRQQGLEPDAAGQGLRERHALAVLILRTVVRDDGVDDTTLQPLDDRQTILFRAQRRYELAEGAVVADREIVQREVGRGGVAGYLEPAILRARDHLDRFG